MLTRSSDSLKPARGCPSITSYRRRVLPLRLSPSSANTGVGTSNRIEREIRFKQTSSSPHRRRPKATLERTLRRSEEHTSELQSLMRISYAVFCLKKKITKKHNHN